MEINRKTLINLVYDTAKEVIATRQPSASVFTDINTMKDLKRAKEAL